MLFRVTARSVDIFWSVLVICCILLIIAILTRGKVMGDLYRVVWANSGREVTADELEQIALHEPWARGLIYCDIEGFAVDQDGMLLLLDECGNHRYPPAGLFRVEWSGCGTSHSHVTKAK